MKRVVLAVAAIFIAAGLWAAGGSESKKDVTEKMSFRMGHIWAVESNVNKAAIMFIDKVKESTKGMVEITNFPAGQLGDERTIVESIFMGSNHFTLQGAGFSTGGVPEVSVAELPFLWKNYAHLQKALPEIMVPYMNSKMIPKGVRIMDSGYAYTAYRGTLSRNKPIKTFEDLKGLKIRVPQNPVYVNTFKAAGANTTVINLGELYTALQTGVVDACEMPAETLCDQKLYEVAKYFSKTQHIVAPLFIGVNETVWGKLPKYQQEIQKAAAESMSWLRNAMETGDEKFLQVLKDNGVTVVDPGDGEREKFRNAVQKGYWEEFFSKYPETRSIAEKVLSIN